MGLHRPGGFEPPSLRGMKLFWAVTVPRRGARAAQNCTVCDTATRQTTMPAEHGEVPESGRSGLPAKEVWCNSHRGFESHPLRHVGAGHRTELEAGPALTGPALSWSPSTLAGRADPALFLKRDASVVVLPPIVRVVAAGRPVRLVWENEAGGLTFEVGTRNGDCGPAADL